jgi:glucose-6-phosphate 1-dehydrogenase
MPTPSKQTPAAPCTIVVFGSRGDLAQRKLWPALYNLALDNALPPHFAILGLGRKPYTPEQFHEAVCADVTAHSRRPPEPERWRRFCTHLSYFSGDFGRRDTYAQLALRLTQLDAQYQTEGNRIFYFAVPPSITPEVLPHLYATGLLTRQLGAPFIRGIFEKPFGHDLDSAVALNQQLRDILDERQIYRIDHYLAKETVQNIFVFRFGNSLFEPAWTRQAIDHVQITMAEDIGIGNRGAFYEEVGVIRDVVQNHLLQLLTLVAMEPPVAFDPEAIRDEQAKVLRAVRPFAPERLEQEVVLGQYADYHAEPHIPPDSRTPTYLAMRLFIDNWRWQGVPFYLRAGKRLTGRMTEIAIQFRAVPVCMFPGEGTCQRLHPNVLTLRIQPHEGINLAFMVKPPGPGMEVEPAEMKFCYHCQYGYASPEAYERVILNCLQGDPTLFVRSDAMEAQWRIVTPVLHAWQDGTLPVLPYPSGSWGPSEGDNLLARESRSWWGQ